MSQPLLAIAAGGTGGHMFPAQALAEEMLARGWRVELTTDARGLRYAAGFPQQVGRVELKSSSVLQGGIGARVAAPAALLNGTLAAMGRFRRDPPAVVAGFGGYPAFPALAAARLRRIPSLIHEQNGVLGRVNRLFAGRVARVACGTWPVTNPPAGARLVKLGNPVRRAVLEVRDRPYRAPGEGPVPVLVFGGSQGASAFSRLVPAAIAALPEALRARLRVTQQVRQGEEQGVGEAYARAGVEAELAPFFDDIPARMADAALVIARAGASTVAELSVLGRPSILVPYPHAMDDHQTANARALADAGAALVAPEAGLTPEHLSGLIGRVLGQPEEAAAMAARAREAGNPTAARDLADLVAELGNRATST